MDSSSVETTVTSVFDSKIYKKFQKLKPGKRVVSLTVFADGVENLNQKFYTLIIKVNDLNCKVRAKTFLNGAALSSKPNLEQFLRELIDDLNRLWENGIFVKRSGTTVFPYLHCFLLDGKARPDFLVLSHCNTKHFCNGCYVEGYHTRKGAGFCHVFEHGREVLRLRTHHESAGIAESIQNGQIAPSEIPMFGFKGRSPLFDICYLDIVKQVPPLEPMHTYLAGTVKRDFQSMQDASNKGLPCFISPALRATLQRRIDQVRINSNFKRSLGQFDRLCWKSNQFADFFFNVGPVVFRSILGDEAYGHYLVSVYLISRVWNGGVDLNEIERLKQLVQAYLAHHRKIYPLTDQTSNLHTMNHLVDTFVQLGPLKDQNGFIFEAINGECKELLKGPNAILEQLASRSLLNLLVLLNDDKLQDNSMRESSQFVVLGKGKLQGGRTYYRAIRKGTLEFKCSKFYNGSAYNEFFALDENGKCFLIESFFIVNGEVCCDAREIVLYEHLTVRFNATDLPLEHIHHAVIGSRKISFNVHSLTEKVMFVQKFDSGRSSCSDVTRGFIVRSIHAFHN